MLLSSFCWVAMGRESWINPCLYQSIPQFRVSTGISPLHINNYFLGALRGNVRLPSVMLYEKLLSPPLPVLEDPIGEHFRFGIEFPIDLSCIFL